MAAISMETNRGILCVCVFSIFFHTDHNKCTMKWLGSKISKTVFRPEPPLGAILEFTGIIDYQMFLGTFLNYSGS